MSVYDEIEDEIEDEVRRAEYEIERRYTYWSGWSPLAFLEQLFPTHGIVDIIADHGAAGATSSEIWHGFGWRKWFTSVYPALAMLMRAGRVSWEWDETKDCRRFFIAVPE
jgi:hypothetical protein